MAMSKIHKTSSALYSLLLLPLLLPCCQTGDGVGRSPASRPAHSPARVTEPAAATQSPAATKPTPTKGRAPCILVTNDDGIDSPGLHALVLEMAKVGEVVVVAPASNRSASSHSIVTTGPLLAAPHKVPGAKEAWAVSGTPADAVNFGIIGIGKKKRFDLVVSGINRGSNVGLIAHYSGTVGAAMEGVYHGVPGIAVSESSSQLDHGIAARFTRSFVKKLWAEGAPSGIGYTINVPAGPKAHMRGVAVARMGGSYIDVTDWVREPKAGAGAYMSRALLRRDGPEGSDTKAYYQGMITVVPIRLDWTDAASLARLREWKLTVQ
jgi:5'-nucleotidase